MPQPNLLLAGFVKCGSTALAKYLAHHPAILAPAAKELYYLVDDDSPLASMRVASERMGAVERCVNAGPVSYADYFPIGNGERYALDATPHYYSQAVALEYVRANREVKVIFMIRDPVARLVSGYRFFLEMFQEYPPTSFAGFVDALFDSRGRRNAYRRRIRKASFRYLFDVELDMGCYERHLARWRSAVGRERMFIGTMEELREVPSVMMRRLCRFLGLDAAIYDTFDFAPYRQSCEARSARRTLEGIYQRIQVGRSAELDHRSVARLYDFYLPHNRRLRDTYDIDYIMPGVSPKELRPAVAAVE